MSRVGYDPKLGNIKTDSQGVLVDRGFIAHFQVSAANALVTSNTAVHADINLGAATQNVTTGITNPGVPRNLLIKGNVSGITGNVVLTGTNYNGDSITETIALNGSSAVLGAKAFRTLTNIALPVQVHTPTAQVETATAAGTVTVAGNASVVVTAAGMTGSPKTIDVAVEVDDSANDIALAIRTALAADEDVSALFTVSGATDKVILTVKTPLANDSTLNIAIADGTSTGVTTAASSANTTAGVPYDKVSIGFGEKLGLPYKLTHNTLLKTYLGNTLEANAPTVTVSATALESNTVDLDSALNGSIVDIYLIV